MSDIRGEDGVIVSFRRRKGGAKNRYMTRFEDAARDAFGFEMVNQRRLSYNLVRIFDALRGRQNINSLSRATQLKINRLGELLGISDRPYMLPSLLRTRVSGYDVVMLFCGQIYELRTFDSINWEDTFTIVYVADAWEPRLSYFSSLIAQYDIDAVFCSYQRATEILRTEYGHSDVYWLPQGIDPSLWCDYGLDKEYTAIQFGRKNPTLHEFATEQFPDSYVEHYIEGDENLGRYINRSWFCLVGPRVLQDPEHTGDISPVTLRFYQAMAGKSMPAGFKPREFDDIFEEDIFMLEFDSREQFLSDIQYYLDNPDEYWEKVERNYDIVMNNHTWADRASEMRATVRSEHDREMVDRPAGTSR